MINMEYKFPVGEVKMTIRLENILKGAGIEYLDQLSQMSSKELLKWRNFGKKALRDARETLAIHGLSLRDDVRVSNDEHKNLIIKIPEFIIDIRNKISEIELQLRVLSSHLDHIYISLVKDDN